MRVQHQKYVPQIVDVCSAQYGFFGDGAWRYEFGNMRFSVIVHENLLRGLSFAACSHTLSSELGIYEESGKVLSEGIVGDRYPVGEHLFRKKRLYEHRDVDLILVDSEQPSLHETGGVPETGPHRPDSLGYRFYVQALLTSHRLAYI